MISIIATTDPVKEPEKKAKSEVILAFPGQKITYIICTNEATFLKVFKVNRVGVFV